MSAVLAAIARHAAQTPDALALVCGAERYSYKSLAAAIERSADALNEVIGAAPGCVAVSLENSAAWVILDLALIRVSRPALPLPGFFTREQITHALKDSGARWLVSANGDREPLSIASRSLRIKSLPGDLSRLPCGTAKVTYTSGSTGAPKGVCLSQSQMESVAQSIVDTVGAEFADVHAALLPLAVLLENVAGLYAVLLAGGCYTIETPSALGLADPFKPDFAQMGRTLVAVGATSLIVVPELLRGMLMARAFGAMEWPALKLVAVGGAKVAPDLIVSARAAGLPVYEGYGLTECASVVALNTPMHDRAGSVGRPLPHVKIKILDDGEIVVGPEPFLAYAGGATRRRAVRTGDIGRLDEDGFLYVTGRKSNVIINSFGRNISPEWVESELLAQPEIRYAIVFGEAQAGLTALVAPSVATMDLEHINAAIARANTRLPAYARVMQFLIVAPFSAAAGHLTGNGRPRRAALLETYRTLVESEG